MDVPLTCGKRKKNENYFWIFSQPSFAMEGIDGCDYIVYVPPRWSIPQDWGSYINIQYVWNVEACVVWERGDTCNTTYGTFGECWESKEWRKGSLASFWLVDGNDDWAFFTNVKNDDLPMSRKEYVVWCMLGHLVRVLRMCDRAYRLSKH